jgi:pimeloyl-ACP methyl ester carboxylesterase
MAAAEDCWLTLPKPPPMPAPVTSGYAPVNGIDMYYAVFCSGDPVLLIHGGLGHADIWSNQVADLHAKRRVGMINIHGIYGISFPDLETWSGNHLLPSSIKALQNSPLFRGRLIC